MSFKLLKSGLYAAMALPLGATSPLLAAEPGTPAPAPDADPQHIEEITVTARRFEERLRDVPISISVYSQAQISQQNVVTASDLARNTPSLSTDTRFGPDLSSFSIRGFTQEIRTSPSVGVFFDDAVAPRGGGAGTTAGDGAGPGDYFDLQNVQVLKGPQGTLFGRNTTGGDVLLVPNRPTDNLGGYIEQSFGNLDLERTQGVLNVPISDNLRARVGFDRETRDGYLNNVTGIGPSTFNDVDYYAFRAAIDYDITPELNNYTVATYSNSNNNGTIGQIFACNPAGGQNPFFGPSFLNAGCLQAARQSKLGPWDVQNSFPDPVTSNETWRVINTTTWDVLPDLTIKNIASYSQFRSILRGEFFGDDFTVGPTFLGIPTGPLQGTPVYVTNSNAPSGFNSDDQQTLSEELQFQGTGLADKLLWQGGLYFELSNPLHLTGSNSANNSFCSNQNTIPAQCTDILGELFNPIAPGSAGALGGSQFSEGSVTYHNLGVYEQSTYAITDQLKVTAGLRYTSDLTEGEGQQFVFNYPIGAPPRVSCNDPSASPSSGCFKSFRQHSQAPTGVIDLEYKPIEDLMLYAKYSRGYRQGGVDPFGAAGFTSYSPEQIDAYELGEKAVFGGPVPGSINFDVFYNNLHNQQLQVAFANTAASDLAASSTTGILNAGESRIYGAEVDSSLRPFDNFKLDLNGTYLNTKLESEQAPVLPANSFYNLVVLTSRVGGPLPFSPKFKGSATGTYTLPVPENIGKVSIGMSYMFTGRELTSSPVNSPFSSINSTELINLFANWDEVGGSPINVSFFANNLTNQQTESFIPGFYGPFGFEVRNLGEPMTFGFRVRYIFGS
jgi:iron complex outermembrane recepter protein